MLGNVCLKSHTFGMLYFMSHLIKAKEKVSFSLAQDTLSTLDTLLEQGKGRSRSSLIDEAVALLKRQQDDAWIEAQVALMDVEEEIALAEEGMDDYSQLVLEHEL
jgi:Arc/MetJ-type ribon-helix-helix transcriptional regulator